MADIFPPSLAFAGFCRKLKRTISLNHTECASKQMSEHTKIRSHKKRSLSPHSPSPSLSSEYSSDPPSKSLAHTTTVGNTPRRYSPRHPAIVSSDQESTAFRKSGHHQIDNGLTSNALISRVSVTTTACSLPCVSRRKRAGAPSSSSSSSLSLSLSPVDDATIPTTISTTSKKPVLFINNIAPVIPRPKSSTTAYVPSQSALQQKVRKKLQEGYKIKRSSNCFIKYRTYMHPFIVAKYGNQNNKEISKLAGRSWRNEPEHVKEIYRQQASEEKQRHESLYPSYVYTPARQNQRKDGSNCAPDCSSTAKSTSAAPPRSDPQHYSLTSDNPIKYESSQEFVKRSKKSRRTKSSSNNSSSAASEKLNSTEKPFVVTETPLHDFNGDSELAAQKRPASKSRRHRGSKVDESKSSGSCLSKDSISFAKTTATIPPSSALGSDAPSFEPLCHLFSSTVVPVDCTIDLPSSQSMAHEEAWMVLDLSQDFPNMSARSEVLGSLFSSSLGYPLLLPERMAASDQAPIPNARPVSELGHHYQPYLQYSSAPRSVDILGQSFTFPQVQEFSETALLTKPLLSSSVHQSLSWELSGTVPKSLDPQTYDYSSTSIDASVPLFSNQILSLAAASTTDLPQDFANPGDSTTGEFSRSLWFADATSAKAWPPSLFSSSSMAIAASNADPPSSSSPESSSSRLFSPACGNQGDTIQTSMAPPLPLPYDAFFDLVAPKDSPVNEWAVPGATSDLGDPMTAGLVAGAAISNNTKTYINSSRQDGGFCYINGSSSNNTGNNSMEDPRLLFQQPHYEYLQQQPSTARVDGGVHGCSDDELQRSIAFYERVLEQQKLQLSMQRQIREQTQQQHQHLQHQLFSNDICLQEL